MLNLPLESIFETFRLYKKNSINHSFLQRCSKLRGNTFLSSKEEYSIFINHYQDKRPFFNIYISKTPTIHATKSPTITGIKFRLTRSTGLTPETPESAATPKAQAAKVPPPTKIPAT